MATFTPVQAQKMTLSGSGATATATSIVLTSMKQIDGSTTLTMADFGSIGYGVLEPGTSREETISFTGITQNASGTATLTGVTRGLKFVSDYTQDTALRQAHAGGTIFILTNPSVYYNEFVTKKNQENIAGVKTFTTIPKTSAGDPIADEDLVRKKYVDDNVAGGTVSHNKVVVAGTAGVTIAAGELIYFDATDDEWKLCDADLTATVDRVLLGIAQGSGIDGGAITDGVLLYGIDDNQSGMTIGDTMYASNTAGAIASTAGTIEVEVGIAKSATELYFSPRYASTPKADEIDAMAGTSGTPSSTNKFVTEDDPEYGKFEKFIFGETIAVGEAVYLKASDQKVYKTDASFDDERIHSFVGIAKEAGDADETKKVVVSGIITGLSGLTAGSRYYLSDTAGAIATTPGTYKKHVGIATLTTALIVQNQANFSDFGAPVRAKDTEYQNGNNWRMIMVTVNLSSGAAVNQALLKIGVASPAATVISRVSSDSSTVSNDFSQIAVMIPPKYYYKLVTGSGTIVVGYWYEIDLRW